MREIKFRGWTRPENIMLDVKSIHELIYKVEMSEQSVNRIVFMQYTGLLDKNDKEIYEGDIVRILYTDWSSKLESDKRTLQQYLIDIATIGVIEFNEDRFCVKTKSKKYSDFNYSSILPGKHGYIEIIGNIYENSELLK